MLNFSDSTRFDDNFKVYMKYLKTLVLFSFLLVFSCKKEKFNNNLIIDFNLKSVKGYTYDISVALPVNFDKTKKHRTTYFLDKDWDFEMMSNAAKKAGNGSKYNEILVGIGWGNSKRERDYTPTQSSQGDGGADDFINFIKSILIPYIENNFNADTSRISRCISGHSFGGLFVAYCFTNHHYLFGNYLALSPSLWYAEQVELINEIDNKSKNQMPTLMFSSMGGTESYGMLPAFMIWKNSIENNYPNLKKKIVIVDGQGHQGAKKASINDAFTFYFENRN